MSLTATATQTAPAYTDQSIAGLSLDTSGNLRTTVASFYYAHLNASGTTTLKSGAGRLGRVTVNNPGTGASITLYDNTSGSGTVIAAISGLSTIGSFIYDVQFSTGLTIVIAGTTPPDVTVSYA